MGITKRTCCRYVGTRTRAANGIQVPSKAYDRPRSEAARRTVERLMRRAGLRGLLSWLSL